MFLNDSPLIKAFNDEKGVGLPTAIFVILIMSVVAIVVSRFSLSSSESFSRSYLSAQAFYAAEAAIHINLAELERTGGGEGNCISPVNFVSTGLVGCESTVTCQDQSAMSLNFTELTSVGQCGVGVDASFRTLRVQFRR